MSKLVHSAVLGIASLALIPAADAAIVTMVNSNGSGQSWNTASAWSNNAAASAGNDYIVGPGNPTATTLWTVRTPTTNNTVFPGNSLTLDGGQLNPQVANSTVNNLTVKNGGVIVNPTTTLVTLNGDINFVGTGATPNWIRTAATGGADRNMRINSTITGSGDLRVAQQGQVTIAGTGNAFSGNWYIGGTNLTIPGSSSNPFIAQRPTVFKALTPNSLGTNANVLIEAWGEFDVDYDWTTTGFLSIGGANAKMHLDQDITVGALFIDGGPYRDGTFTFADLAPSHQSFFTDGGGSITVVIPEPTSALLLAGLATLALTRRPRRA